MQREFIRVGAQNVIYDGVNLSDYFNITEYTIAPFPAREVKSVQVPGKAGTTFVGVTDGERTITLKMSIRGQKRDAISLHDQWMLLNPLLLKDSPRPLYLRPDRFINAIVTDGGDLERKGVRAVSDVNFTANDPYFYGAEHVTALEEGENTFVVLGEEEIVPVFQITGVSGALELTNVATGEKIVIPSVATAETVVKIDLARRRCTADDEYLPVDIDKTDFFKMGSGEMTLNLSAGTGTLTYRERFR